MGLVATLRAIKNSPSEELSRVSNTDPRTVMVDGSLSEMVTQALNLAYTKKDFTTGEMNYGDANPTGLPPRGAGYIADTKQPDAPQSIVKPSLEGMEQMQSVETQQIAAVLAGAVDLSREKPDGHLGSNPLVIYAIPDDGMIPQEMNNDLDCLAESGSIDINDFIFIYSDSAIPKTREDTGEYVDARQKLKDYEKRGARAFPDLQSFLRAFPAIRGL